MRRTGDSWLLTASVLLALTTGAEHAKAQTSQEYQDTIADAVSEFSNGKYTDSIASFRHAHRLCCTRHPTMD